MPRTQERSRSSHEEQEDTVDVYITHHGTAFSEPIKIRRGASRQEILEAAKAYIEEKGGTLGNLNALNITIDDQLIYIDNDEQVTNEGTVVATAALVISERIQGGYCEKNMP